MLSHSLGLFVQVPTAHSLLTTLCYNRDLKRTLHNQKSQLFYLTTIQKFVNRYFQFGPLFLSLLLSPPILSVIICLCLSQSLSLLILLDFCFSRSKKKKVSTFTIGRIKRAMKQGSVYWAKEEATMYLGLNYLNLSEQLLHPTPAQTTIDEVVQSQRR